MARATRRTGGAATEKEVAKVKMTFHLLPDTAKRIRIWAADENLTYSQVVEALMASSPDNRWVSRRYRSSGPDVAGPADGADDQAA